MLDRRGRRLAAALVAAAALTVAGCGSGRGASGPATSADASALTVETTFDLSTLDPARISGSTSSLLVHQVYETAVGYADDDLDRLEPEVTSWVLSPDATTLTLTLTGTHTFADGTPVTVDDIVFSYRRVQGIGADPSSLLAGVTVTKVDDTSLRLTSTRANPELPAVLANPALGIVERSVVEANGGGADASDKAGDYLDTASAGSGPYTLDKVDLTSRVTLSANPHYAGSAPTRRTVVVRDATPATQRSDLQSGTSQVALDLAPDDSAKLVTAKPATTAVQVVTGESLSTVYLWFATDPDVGGAVAEPSFVAAVRAAIDTGAVAKAVGTSAALLTSVIPRPLPGVLTGSRAVAYDPTAAKAALARAGYAGEPVKLLLDGDSDVLAAAAGVVQTDLKAVGINVELSPMSAATALTTFQDGTYQAGLATWTARYPDPSDYLAFTPGGTVASRLGWLTDADDSAREVTPYVAKALGATTAQARTTSFEQLMTQLNTVGPYVPLLQPTSQVVAAAGLTGIVDNPVYRLTFAAVG